MHPYLEKMTLQLYRPQSLRQSSQPGEVVGQGMPAVLLVALAVAVQVGVEGLDILLKEAAQAAETSWCVVKVAVLWDESTTRQLKLSICSNQLGNISPFQDKNGI